MSEAAFGGGAHPRWRGEHDTGKAGRSAGQGSSPLARGALRPGRENHTATGLIPAGAGSTTGGQDTGAVKWAHPRWRGEHSSMPIAPGSHTGSSPLARGAQLGRWIHARWRGLIPAGAGSTMRPPFDTLINRAHPRWRGEHRCHTHCHQNTGGSSPLARGARGAHSATGRPARLIPAGAGSTGQVVSHWCSISAHPRWRGEHHGSISEHASATGSSPLARGALFHALTTSGQCGLIPAGAGSTIRWAGWSASTRAHPRWRGEHDPGHAADAHRPGSSPLARGARQGVLLVHRGEGLIPAGAGSTYEESNLYPGGWAHPRWRGEHRTVSIPSAFEPGSSPLARGALFNYCIHFSFVGLIPAGAGSTSALSRTRITAEAHPRWRGEHVAYRCTRSASRGSSPLARGAPARVRSTRDESGLIPAGAGSTSQRPGRDLGPGAHPRWRGEHWPSPPKWLGSLGSSPLARGALDPVALAGFYVRLIPAGAGSTSTPRTQSTSAGAHPRWRGEHCRTAIFSRRVTGSSPLARGAHTVFHIDVESGGLIPAGAGSTTG